MDITVILLLIDAQTVETRERRLEHAEGHVHTRQKGPA